jgi:hypothetical protein
MVYWLLNPYKVLHIGYRAIIPSGVNKRFEIDFNISGHMFIPLMYKVGLTAAQRRALPACGWARCAPIKCVFASKPTLKNRAVASRVHALVGRNFGVKHLIMTLIYSVHANRDNITTHLVIWTLTQSLKKLTE